jgi:hypothetical protein
MVGVDDSLQSEASTPQGRHGGSLKGSSRVGARTPQAFDDPLLLRFCGGFETGVGFAAGLGVA